MEQTEAHSSGMVPLIAGMLGFVLVGGPMVYYLWTTLNQVLEGHAHWGRVGISIIVLLIFLGLLRILTGAIRRWDERLQS